MVLSSPTFRIEILPNALAAIPTLFTGLDSVLPALDIQLEETLSSLKGKPTEVLITSNVEQGILDSRPVFLVHPAPDSKSLCELMDTGRAVRWIPDGTPQSTWVDSFARFLYGLRVKEATPPRTLQVMQPSKGQAAKKAS